MKTAADYWGNHRPPEDTPTINRLDDPDSSFPPADVYEHPEYYWHSGTSYDRESARIIRQLRGRPDSAQVTIYRALPQGHTKIGPGDWVAISEGYAREHAKQDDDPDNDWPVISATVAAGTVRNGGNDIVEWGYWGPPIEGRVERGHMMTGSTEVLQHEAATVENDYSDHVMVALRPPQSVCDAYSRMSECTEDDEDLHLTLVYLGTINEDLTDLNTDAQMARERLYRACYATALEQYEPIVGKPNGFGWFLNDDAHVLVSLWDTPYLSDLRTRLLDNCHSHGVRLRQEDHGFTPHMTLSYKDDTDTRSRTIPDLPEGGRGEVRFTGMWLYWGEDDPQEILFNVSPE